MNHLSNGEFKVMDTIWTSETPLTQAGVMKAINDTLETKLNVSTYATYLRRIIAKGYLEKVHHGDGHPTYRPTLTKTEYFERCAKEFYERWGTDMILELVKNSIRACSPEQIESLMNEIKK